MELRPRESSQFLLDALLRALHQRGELRARVCGALTTKSLIEIFAPLGNALPDIVWWFRMLDGQPNDAEPLLADRKLRALQAKSAMRARREAEPQGVELSWVPLFADAKERIVCWTGAGDALAYLGTKGPKLPTLDALLMEELVRLGVRSAEPISRSPEHLPSLLEELDALMRTRADQRGLTVGFASGATVSAQKALARTVGLDELPEDLASWFAWHDGEPSAYLEPEEDDDEPTRRRKLDPRSMSVRALGTVDLHERVAARALGVDAARAEYARLDEDDEDIWNPGWLPLFRFPAGGYWAYVLTGDERGSIAYVPGDRGRGAHVDYPDLASLARECRDLLSRAIDQREVTAPPGYHATDGQRRVLGVGAILTQINGERFDLLGGEPRGLDAASSLSVLRTYWDAVDGDDVCELAESLLAPHEATLAAGGFTRPVNDSVAFDVGRVHGVVGNAWVGMLLNAQRAWDLCMRAARIAQAAYASWEELGTAYASARLESGLLREPRDDSAADDEELAEHERLQRVRDAWANERYRHRAGDAALAVGRLLAPGGAWHGLSFDGPLDDSPAVLPDRAVTKVSSTEELVRAIESASDGDVISLAPGTYTHKLHVSARALFFVASGPGVIWEATGPESCIMEDGGQFASFEGITFRAKGPWFDAPATCAHVSDGVLHFERCVFEAAWSGIVVGAGAVAILTDCTITGATSGVMCSRGRLVMRGCTVVGGDAGGVLVTGGVGRLHDTRITDTGGHGLCVEGSEVHAVGLQIERSTVSSIGVLGRGHLALRGGRLRGSMQSGIMTQPGAQLVLGDTEISGVEKSGIAAVDAVLVSLAGCKISDCKENAVLLSGFSTSAGIFDCDLRDTGLTVVACVGKPGARVHLRGTTVGESRTMDGLYASGCTVRMHDMTFERAQRSAMFFEGGSVRLSDVRIEGAVDSGVVANGGARLHIAGARITKTQRCLHLEGDARALLVSSDLSESVIGAVVRTGASLVAVDSRFSAIEQRGIVAEDAGTAVAARCRFFGASGWAVIAIEGSAILVRSEIDGPVVGVAVADGDVELHGCNVHHAGDAGVQAAKAGRAAIYDTVLSGDDMNVLFAHDNARLTATACELSSPQGNGCKAVRSADVELTGCTIRANQELVVDASSNVRTATTREREKTPRPSIVRSDDRFEWSVPLDELPVPEDAPLERALGFLEAAVDLFEPAPSGALLLQIREEKLIASAEVSDALHSLATLLARLRTDAPARRWTVLAADAGGLRRS